VGQTGAVVSNTAFTAVNARGAVTKHVIWTGVHTGIPGRGQCAFGTGIHTGVIVGVRTGALIIITTTIRAEVLVRATSNIINTGSIGIHILVRTTTGGGIIITFIIRTKILC
jgi:hypothetical protein